MNERFTLLASALLVAFFFLAGLLDILDNFLVMMILFIGFFGIVINIVIIKSRDDHKKNPP
jgi:hypothetical protein